MSITGYIRDFQIEGYATLLRAFQITRATELQVRFRYFKTIARLHHNLKTFSGFLCKFIRSHQNTIRLIGTTPYASAQLMQLRQTEPVGVFDYHYICIRDIDADFDDE